MELKLTGLGKEKRIECLRRGMRTKVGKERQGEADDKQQGGGTLAFV